MQCGATDPVALFGPASTGVIQTLASPTMNVNSCGFSYQYLSHEDVDPPLNFC
jgi:hypothetical protein